MGGGRRGLAIDEGVEDVLAVLLDQVIDVSKDSAIVASSAGNSGVGMVCGGAGGGD